MNTEVWKDVCHQSALMENGGVCVLFEGRQIALFLLSSESKEIYALDNYDPFAKAQVLSRGILGSFQGEPIVSSPIYKNRFSLRTGQCLGEEAIGLNTYPSRIHGDKVQLSSRALSPCPV